MATGSVKRTPSTRWRHTIRGVVLHPDGVDDPVLVTSPGDAVWEAIAEPISVDDLVAVLARHFEADPDELRGDVEDLIDQLIALGAVQHLAPG